MTTTSATGRIERVEWADPRAVLLREAMDAEMWQRYADRFEGLDENALARLTAALTIDPASIVATVIVFDGDEPVGHAALRDLGGTVGEALEVKRVFVHRDARGTGASRRLMAELESIALQHGADRLVLQTGDRQPDAVTLYERIGYRPIDVYPPYLAIAESLCFEKSLLDPTAPDAAAS